MRDRLTNIFYDDRLSRYAYDFIEASKGIGYDQFENNHIQQVLESEYVQRCISNSSLELGNVNRTPLPKPACDPAGSVLSGFLELQQNRRSTRNFGEGGISFQSLSSVLRATSRIVQSGEAYTRTIASAGGLYPIDIYLIILNVEDLNQGVVHYNQVTESLDEIPTTMNVGEAYDRIFMTSSKSDIAYGNAAGAIVFVGTLRRAAFKYGDRGLRYAMLEAGELTQNFYLACAALDGIGCCACGGIFEESLLNLIGRSSADEIVANVILFGANEQ